MSDNARIRQLLEYMLESNRTPEEVCSGDAELLREVRLGWKRLRRVEGQLEALFPASTAEAPDGAEALRPPDKLPQVEGYQIQCVLGLGGMGVVYQARCVKLNRMVALKMLLAGAYAVKQDLARFMREAEAAATLRHPNIVQVYEVGDLEGLPFFTMEFVEGGSLARALAGKPQPARGAAELVAVLAGAVQFAHAGGIIHRDLKPANILLTADGTPKITDFGLARRVEGGPEFTVSGARVGTPSYMAPEQALGKASAIGPPVDVYALGAILYKMLTGRPPFKGETALETERQVIADEPVPPSRLNPKAPRDLETICLKCLHKTPARRYASARELAEDLRRFLEGKPVRARPVGAAERVVKWARRRPAAALLVAALLVLFGAAAGTGLWLRQQEADRQAAKTQREGEVREAVEAALGRAEDLRREERWGEALLALTEASGRIAEAGSPPLEERLGRAQSDLRTAADLERARENGPLEPLDYFYYKQRAAEFQAAFERAGLRVGGDAGPVADAIQASAIRDQLAAGLDDWALAAFMVNDHPALERLLRIARSADPEPRWRDRFRDPAVWSSREQLLQLAADAFSVSPPPPGHQLALLGLLLRRAGAWSESTRLLGEACRRRPGDFWLSREMGNALFIEARYVDSAAYYRAALALRPDNAGAYEGLGAALFETGQTDDALAAFRRMVELSPDGRSTHGYYMGALAGAGRWVEAAAECRRALDADPTDYRQPLRLGLALWDDQRDEDAIAMFRKVTDAGIRDVNAYQALGRAYGRTNRHDEAVTALRKATQLTPVDTNLRQLLAHELDAVGHAEEAIAELQTAIDRAPTAILYKDLGASFRAQGRPEEAAAAFRKAADLAPGFTAALDGLAASLLDTGRFAEARAATERLLDLPATEATRRAQRRQLDFCDALLSVDADLPAILAGKKRPAEASAQLGLAAWCLKHKRLPATAAGYYETALAAKPSLADDPEAGNRYDAACAAAAAGCGIGEDVAELDGQRRTALRRQALDWLTAEYDAWAARHRVGNPGDRTVTATAVRSWLQNDNLAGVRDEQALARLPLDERQAWRTLWADVAALAARDPVALLDQARMHVGRQEWREAAECYSEGLELEPTDNGELWFECAASQLLAGDRPGYRRTCAHMVARGQATPPMRPYLVARACTLAPDSADDPAQPVRLSADELGRSRTAFWSLTEQGALLVRSGRFQDAVPPLERSLVADGRPGRAVLNWLWLALAYQHMGKADEARRWLDRAAGWLDQQGGRMPLETPDMGLHRHNWLEANVLRQEAEALLR